MQPFITNFIEISASSNQVWDALVNPEKTKIYMFGCETVSDWNVGSSLDWKGSYEGKEMVFVKGSILKMEPNIELAYTVFDPFSSLADIPENYLTVTYLLKKTETGTTLTVTQGDYTKVGEGERRYNDSYNNGEGWNPILLEIKKLVEAN